MRCVILWIYNQRLIWFLSRFPNNILPIHRDFLSYRYSEGRDEPATGLITCKLEVVEQTNTNSFSTSSSYPLSAVVPAVLFSVGQVSAHLSIRNAIFVYDTCSTKTETNLAFWNLLPIRLYQTSNSSRPRHKITTWISPIIEYFTYKNIFVIFCNKIFGKTKFLSLLLNYKNCNCLSNKRVSPYSTNKNILLFTLETLTQEFIS